MSGAAAGTDQKTYPDNPVGNLAREIDSLLGLREVSYRELAKRIAFSHTVVWEAAQGKKVPTEAVLLAIVRSCTQGFGNQHRQAEERRFLRLREEADQWLRNCRQETEGRSQ